jgi:predicted dehydrogenase
MGNLRADSASAHPACRVTHIVDTNGPRAEQLAKRLNCTWSIDWESAICRADVDVVVVATSHRFLAPVTIAAAKFGRHVFCEKPLAYNLSEAELIVAAIEKLRRDGFAPKVLVGFTLRHHPGVAKAHQLLKEGAIGQPYYIRAHYGHGGRPGYDREWRMNKELGGGGELLDQGVHLIDLSRWFLGDFATIEGGIGTYFWTGSSDSDAPVKRSFTAGADSVEDNAFMLLRTSIGQTALLHASWTQWQNSFQLEVFGRDGALTVSGLGGSYGAEKLTCVHRRPLGGVPEITEIPIHETGSVWDREWSAFMEVIEPGSSARDEFSEPASVADGLEVLRIVDRLYNCASRAALQDAVVG